MARPRDPVTPAGKLSKAFRDLKIAPEDFPHFRRATLRAVLKPDEIFSKKIHTNQKDAHYVYRYTGRETGEILAFTWWTYCNIGTFDRKRLRAAATVLSPLRMYSSAMLAKITDIPQDTVSKAMLKIPGAPTSRVLGVCEISVIHQLLTACQDGDVGTYRETVREISFDGVPQALLARISGVPKLILRRPERGTDFYPQECDISQGFVLDSEEALAYIKHLGKEAKPHEADPGDQSSARDFLAGTPLDSLHYTSTPVPDGFDFPPHLAIPGLPHACDSTGPGWDERINRWSDTYGLLASPGPRHDVPCRCT